MYLRSLNVQYIHLLKPVISNYEAIKLSETTEQIFKAVS